MTVTQTPLRANIDGRFYRKFLLIAVIAIGFALWSLYDGAVAYPNQRIRALEYQKLDEEGRIAEWKDFALERGWPTDPPGEPKTEVDFGMQFIMAGGAGTVGLVFLLVVWRSRGRWIEASETGLNSSWGQSLDFNRVVSINKKQWREKGVAKIKYEDGKRQKRFVLDNYKFEQHATNKILYELESKSGTDKIVGGQPEPPPEQYNEASPQAAAEKSDSPD